MYNIESKEEIRNGNFEALNETVWQLTKGNFKFRIGNMYKLQVYGTELMATLIEAKYDRFIFRINVPNLEDTFRPTISLSIHSFIKAVTDGVKMDFKDFKSIWYPINLSLYIESKVEMKNNINPFNKSVQDKFNFKKKKIQPTPQFIKSLNDAKKQQSNPNFLSKNEVEDEVTIFNKRVNDLPVTSFPITLKNFISNNKTYETIDRNNLKYKKSFKIISYRKSDPYKSLFDTFTFSLYSYNKHNSSLTFIANNNDAEQEFKFTINLSNIENGDYAINIPIQDINEKAVKNSLKEAVKTNKFKNDLKKRVEENLKLMNRSSIYNDWCSEYNDIESLKRDLKNLYDLI